MQSRILTVACALLCLASVVSHASGSGPEVWGVDRSEFSARLRNGDYTFLTRLDISAETPDRTILEASRLGDGAIHMLGLIYADLGLKHIGERLLTASWNDRLHPWRKTSLLELLTLLDEDARYPELEILAREGREVYGDDPQLLRFLIGALYRQQKDAEVVALSALLEREAGGSESLLAEDVLRRAVSSSRLDLPGWEAEYRDLFARFPADDAHSRVWVYLLHNSQVASRFSSLELSFFQAKQLLAEGRSVDAANRFAQASATAASDAQGAGVKEMLISPAGLRDFYLAGSLSGRQSATASLLIDLAEGADTNGLTDDLAARALEYAGRLYRTAGNYWQAAEILRRSLLLQSAGTDAERVRWYGLSSRLRMDPVDLANSLGDTIPTLSDPDYYSDLFAELASRLAGMERWDVLQNAYEAIREFATAGTLAAYEITLAEAIGAGRLPAGTGGRANDGEALRLSYLERATLQREDLYAAIVASYLLGNSGEAVLGVPAGALLATPGAAAESTGRTEDRPKSTSQLAVAQQIAAYLQFGLLDRAYATFRSDPGAVTAAQLRELADYLFERGRVRESIQVAVRIPVIPETPAVEDLRRRYPRAFPAVFSEVLADEAVDPWVLYALVREESLFDPEIVSGAGAIGLTQLLAETAQDVARRMRIDPPELTDPVGNLRVGAHYLVMLDAQFGGLVKAIAAYNAGQGRVRTWERERPGLSGVLFHQSIPFEETRNHIRQIVASAAYYGYLYEGRTPTETVRILFADSSE